MLFANIFYTVKIGILVLVGCQKICAMLNVDLGCIPKNSGFAQNIFVSCCFQHFIWLSKHALNYYGC